MRLLPCMLHLMSLSVNKVHERFVTVRKVAKIRSLAGVNSLKRLFVSQCHLICNFFNLLDESEDFSFSQNSLCIPESHKWTAFLRCAAADDPSFHIFCRSLESRKCTDIFFGCERCACDWRDTTWDGRKGHTNHRQRVLGVRVERLKRVFLRDYAAPWGMREFFRRPSRDFADAAWLGCQCVGFECAIRDILGF